MYLDGDQEDMDNNEVTRYKKPIQAYSRKLTRKPTPTTTPPITTPKGFAMAVKHIKSVADCAVFAHRPEVKLQEYAFVGGKIWDEDLKKFAARKDLANHPNTNIAKRWTRSGVNEFARLFQGYKHIEGLDVLEWIYKYEVPPGQKLHTQDILLITDLRKMSLLEQESPLVAIY